jgi:hypothetical protein
VKRTRERILSEDKARAQFAAALRAGRVRGAVIGSVPGLPPWIKLAKPGELYDAVICLLCDDAHPLMLLDNEIGQCRDCGRRVQHRPGLPPHLELACLSCTVTRLEKSDDRKGSSNRR